MQGEVDKCKFKVKMKVFEVTLAKDSDNDSYVKLLLAVVSLPYSECHTTITPAPDRSIAILL